MTLPHIENKWSLWRPIYPFTWARWQAASYRHFANTLGKQHTVLDIGTGIGSYIAQLPRDNHYIFTDIDPIALQRAETQAQKYLRPGTYQFACCDAETAVKQFGQADIISLIHVITVLPDPAAFYRVLGEHIGKGTQVYLYVNRFSKFIPPSWAKYTEKLGFAPLSKHPQAFNGKQHTVSFLNECYMLRQRSPH